MIGVGLMTRLMRRGVLKIWAGSTTRWLRRAVLGGRWNWKWKICDWMEIGLVSPHGVVLKWTRKECDGEMQGASLASWIICSHTHFDTSCLFTVQALFRPQNPFIRVVSPPITDWRIRRVRKLKASRLRQHPRLSGSILRRPREALSASPWPMIYIRVMSFDKQMSGFHSTYRKVATFVMLLVMNEVCESAGPATRDWEQLVREERVAQRLVKVWRRRPGTCPLVESQY